jgi:hypothetical protein
MLIYINCCVAADAFAIVHAMDSMLAGELAQHAESF